MSGVKKAAAWLIIILILILVPTLLLVRQWKRSLSEEDKVQLFLQGYESVEAGMTEKDVDAFFAYQIEEDSLFSDAYALVVYQKTYKAMRRNTGIGNTPAPGEPYGVIFCHYSKSGTVLMQINVYFDAQGRVRTKLLRDNRDQSEPQNTESVR
jgi:hypothetical protein